MNKEPQIERFLDSEGKIVQLPVKQKPRYAVLAYLAGKFEFGASYTEGQVNDMCQRWHTFNDFYLLRRELIDSGLLLRVRDGSRYWRPLPSTEVKEDA